MPDSSISKFFEKSREERLNTIANFANLSKSELEILENTDGGIIAFRCSHKLPN
jgi:hydroxymethylglutaryl-CoA reductase